MRVHGRMCGIPWEGEIKESLSVHWMQVGLGTRVLRFGGDRGKSAERDFGNGGTLGSGKILSQGNLPVI